MPVLLRSPLGEADPLPESAAATGEFIKKNNSRPGHTLGPDSPRRRRSAPPRARVKRKTKGLRAPPLSVRLRAAVGEDHVARCARPAPPTTPSNRAPYVRTRSVRVPCDKRSKVAPGEKMGHHHRHVGSTVFHDVHSILRARPGLQASTPPTPNTNHLRANALRRPVEDH
jgi:hypothetical protein